MQQIELIKNIFDDFLLLKSFKVDIKVKKKMLKELLEAGPNPWRVVGITPGATQSYLTGPVNSTKYNNPFA